MKTRINHIAIDQHGQFYHNLGPHPRKALLARLGRKHADKQYVDRDGKVYHTGYVIGGLWLTLFKITPFERAR